MILELVQKSILKFLLGVRAKDIFSPIGVVYDFNIVTLLR